MRRLVQRDRGCLSSLSPGQQRLLTLRAGLDGASPRSAAAVARILHLSNAREAGAERQALGDLRGQADHGCRGAVVATSLATFAGTRRTEMVAWITPALGSEAALASGGSSSGAVTSSPRARVKTARSTARLAADLTNGVTRANGKTKSKPGSAQNNGVAVAVNPASSTSSLLPVLIALLALTGAGLLLWPLLQRRRQPAGGSDVASEAKPTSAPPPPAAAAVSPIGPAGAAAAGAAAAGAAVPGATADPPRAATPGAPQQPPPVGPSHDAPRPDRTAGPARAQTAPRPGRNNGRKAAALAVGSAAAMRGLGLVLSRRRRKP